MEKQGIQRIQNPFAANRLLKKTLCCNDSITCRTLRKLTLTFHYKEVPSLKLSLIIISYLEFYPNK